ncbi:hypothetical protein M431DRAFT_502657 [Trichoderma harzianum CBS 226.95]|uniref:Uncharacterized protein n=1 Tax=Trichoderma harzianum CBS 226.95 TaxID=983964 RepID=A0A2T4ATY1_TRIHA|nr:hypothetical protein M431DRAFT_502657 [Trichoderma harzianum CBS 226.95]PTB60527.1 hypothetical protein M431DRAFT_502657 [Trichoderma harzianum CBS 226.95]
MFPGGGLGLIFCLSRPPRSCLIPEMVASCAPRTRFSRLSPSPDAGGVSASLRIPSHGWANDAMFHLPRPRADSNSRVPGWTCVILQSDHACKPLRGTGSG